MLLRLVALLLWLAAPLPVFPAAPEILLANIYQEQVDVTRYLVSEKLDGVRAIWDGEILRFRSGKTVNAPPWFLSALPRVRLDGELWIGRRQFERLSGIVRREIPLDEEWREVKYMIFELPDAPGSFAERAERMRQLVRDAGVPWLRATDQFRVADRNALRARFAEVLRGGGEGLMLHLADAPYATGRSDILLKLKPWLDAEATVVTHLPGKGKYLGMLGALRVRTPEGQVFLLGSGFSDAERRDPPPIGSTVTYRYRELTGGGLPRHPIYLRIRHPF